MTVRVQLLAVVLAALLFTGCSAASKEGKGTQPEKKPMDGRGYYSSGLLAMRHNHYDAAEKDFLEALRLKPDSKSTRLLLVDIYKIKKDGLKLTEQYREIIKLTPTDPRAYQGLMDAYLDMGQVDESIKAGEDAVKAGVPEGNVATRLGWSYYLKGDLDSADAWFVKAMGYAKRDAAPVNDLGIVYFARGNYKKALELFNEADEINPRGRIVKYLTALTYNRLGNEQGAIEALKEGLKRDPQLKADSESYRKTFFPNTDPGDLSPLFDKIKAGK